MRIRRLGIVNTSHFPSFELQFEGDARGLHVVHGPNEAGKSTILRAFLDLLFGGKADDDLDGYNSKSRIYGAFVAENNLGTGVSIPASPQVDPLGILSLAASSQRSNLRLTSGGGLEADVALSEMTFTRGRKSKRLVLVRDGDSVVDEDALSALVGGLDRDRYRLLFGFNHDRLREGGDSLLQSGGHAGISLFEAGGAMLSLQPTLRLLTDRTQAFLDPGFRSNSSKLLNAAYRDYKTLLDSARKSGLRGDDWHRLKNDIDEARRELEALKQERALKTEEQLRLARIARVRKFETQLQEARRRYASFADAEELDIELESTISDHVSLLREVERELRTMRQERETVDERIGKIVVDEKILLAEHALEALQEQMAQYEKARDALPLLANQRAMQEQRMVKIQEGLFPGSSPSVEGPEMLRVPLVVDKEIRRLAKSWFDVNRDAVSVRQQLEEYQAESKNLATLQDAVKTSPFISEARDLLAELGGKGDVEQSLKSLARAIESRKQSAKIRIASQSVWSGAPNELRALPLPLWETISGYVEEFKVLDTSIREFEGKIEHSTAELSQTRDELESMERQGHVPVDEDLISARETRDEGWALVKRAWLGMEPTNAAPFSAYRADVPLHVAYEEAVVKSDEVADVMRKEAGRSAERRTLLAREQWLLRAIETLEQQLEAARDSRGRAHQRWMAEWEPSGIRPKSPSEMKAWHSDVYQPVTSLLQQLDELEEEYEALQEQRDEWLSRMKEILVKSRRENGLEHARASEKTLFQDDHVGSPDGGDPTTLRQLAATLGALVTEADKALARREELRRQREQIDARLSEARRRHASAQQTLAELSEAWSRIRTVHPRLPEDILVAVDYLDELENLFEAVEEAERLAHEWEAEHELCSTFEARVNEVADSLNSSVPSSQVIPWLRSVLGLLKRARNDDSARRSLMEEQNGRDEQIKAKALEMDAIKNDVQQWLARYECRDVEGLRELVARSAEKRQARLGLSQVEADLQKAGDGFPVDKLLEELVKAPAGAQFSLRQEEVSESLTHLDKQIQNLLESLGAWQAKFDAMDGTSIDAANLLQQAEFSLAKVDRYWNEYLRLELARRILERAIDNFRERNESTVIAQASEIFRQLTLGRYVELTVEYDEATPVLEAFHRDGTRRRVSQLSDGTRDQLYLALRLAFVRQHASAGLSVPLVMDDILVHFDDARSSATLEVLRDLSRKTQILYFTHHESIATAASQMMGGDGAPVRVYRIGAGQGTMA